MKDIRKEAFIPEHELIDRCALVQDLLKEFFGKKISVVINHEEVKLVTVQPWGFERREADKSEYRIKCKYCSNYLSLTDAYCGHCGNRTFFDLLTK